MRQVISSPIESHGRVEVPYPRFVKYHKKNGGTWQGWGVRFRQAIRLKGLNLATVAERMDVHESSVRSWTNGHRDINLKDFFRLCDVAGIDPMPILFLQAQDEKLLEIIFAWEQADDSARKLLQVAAKAAGRDAIQRKSGGSSTK